MQGSEINEIVNKRKLCQEAFVAKNYSECIGLCIEILTLEPTDVQTWNLAGFIMIERKDFKRAIEYFSEGLNFAKTQLTLLQDELSTQDSHTSSTALSQAFSTMWNLCAGIWINLAEAYRRHKLPQESIKLLQEALQSLPLLRENATFHFNLAKAYIDAEDPLNSIKHYTIAIKLDPTDLGAMYNLANAHVRLENFPQAIELYQKAYQKGFLKAGINLANTYIKLGYFSQALKIFTEIEPHFLQDSVFIINYANALNYTNANFATTQEYYLRALKLDSTRADFYLNYAHFLLKHKEFAQGFRVYESRKKFDNMLPITLPNLWHKDKEDTLAFKDKVVCVHYEQGFGDCIMFARFLVPLQQIAKEIVFIIQEPLKKLFEDIFASQNMRICTNLMQSDFTHIDISISLLSLPLALGIGTKEQILKNEQYLAYTSMLKRALIKGSADEIYGIKPSTLKIGVCFQSDSNFHEVSLKNIPPEPLFAMLRSLFPDSQKTELYSLTFSGIDSKLCEELEILDCQAQMQDFFQTRKLIEKLDLVISIDTAIAHLSASIGKSTLTLLSKRYDWRYENGINTSWYSNMLCFTQSELNKWEYVLANLKSYLAGIYKEYI